MDRKIEKILKDGIKLNFTNTLLLVNEELDVPVSDLRKTIRDLKLNTISLIKKVGGRYCITEIRDSVNLSQVFMSLDSYREKHPQNWIRLKDVLREYYPDILKEIGEYHDLSIYQ